MAIEDSTKFLFSRFTDHREILTLVEETQRAYSTLQEYTKTGLIDYLSLCFSHGSSALSVSGRIAGRLRQIEENWTYRHKELFETHFKFNEVADELKGYLSKYEEHFSREDFRLVADFSRRFLFAISPEFFPKSSFRKFGYVSYGMLRAVSEIRTELLRKWYEPIEYFIHKRLLYVPAPDPKEIFRREYALASGLSYADAEIPEEWREKYIGRPDEVPDWGEDDLETLLKKIDFNEKAIGKAIVRTGGAIVCIAGALAKVASLLTVNPLLNDLSLKGLVVGGALAVSPDVARTLVPLFFKK